MGEQEKIAFEEELRAKIAEENRLRERERKRKWREENREHIRQYDRAYRMMKKMCREVKSDE